MRTPDKRQRILSAATAVFAERDFHRVQVSEVAARAGVGKGTVYLYFPTKEHLQRVALEASLQGLRAEVEKASASDAPVDAVLRAIVLSILRFFWRRPELLTLVQRYETSRGRGERQRRLLRVIDTVLVDNGLGGNGTGRHLLVPFLLGLARAAILQHAPDDKPEAVAAQVVELYLHGLSGRGRGATGRRPRSAA